MELGPAGLDRRSWMALGSQEQVLEAWEGLGYYARARNLHRCAQIVTDKFAGQFPNTAAALHELPGIVWTPDASYGRPGWVLTRYDLISEAFIDYEHFSGERKGMIADLVVTPENPLANLKTLYGTGTERLNPATNRQERVGGIRYTIKAGVVYDAKALLADIRAQVAAAKK